MHPQTPVAAVGQRFGECPSKLRTEGVIWLLLQRCGHWVRPSVCCLSRSCSVDASVSGCQSYREDSHDGKSGSLRIQVALAPCTSRRGNLLLASALANAQASSAQKV